MRRNPGGELLWTVGGAAGGFLFTGSIVSGFAPSGPLNYIGQGAVALGGGWALARFVKRPLGVGWTIGGLASLAIKLYSDFTGAAAPGTSFYANTSFPVPTWDQGSPLNWPAYSPGGPANLPVGTSPAASAVISQTGGKGVRMKGRFAS